MIPEQHDGQKSDGTKHQSGSDHNHVHKEVHQARATDASPPLLPGQADNSVLEHLGILPHLQISDPAESKHGSSSHQRPQGSHGDGGGDSNSSSRSSDHHGPGVDQNSQANQNDLRDPALSPEEAKQKAEQAHHKESTNNHISGVDNSQKIFNYFTHNGFTAKAAAGIVGNFQQESSCQPNTHQLGGGPGYGLAQWEASNSVDGGGRLNNLEAFAARNRMPVSGLKTQLEFASHEMQTSYPGLKQEMNNASSAAQAASIFCAQYEGAGIPDMTARENNAQAALISHGVNSVG